MQLAQFTPESLADTRAYWIQTAIDLDMSELEYEVNLDWAQSHINYANAGGDAFAYGIFEPGETVASAIVELVYSQRPGPKVGLLKLLRVIMCPRMAPSQMASAPDVYRQVLDVYAEAIIGTVRLTGSHRSKTVKIFGRNNELLQMLYALNERINAQGGVQSRMEGRWLAIFQ